MGGEPAQNIHPCQPCPLELGDALELINIYFFQFLHISIIIIIIIVIVIVIILYSFFYYFFDDRFPALLLILSSS